MYMLKQEYLSSILRCGIIAKIYASINVEIIVIMQLLLNSIL